MTALKQMKSDKAYQEAFTELIGSWEESEELSEKLQEVTCHLYLPFTHTTGQQAPLPDLLCQTWRS